MGPNSKLACTLMAQHLLAAADRYALDGLKLLCAAKLCGDVSINTAATTLALAEQHHCLQLKAVCMKFIALPKNLRGIFLTLLILCIRLICLETAFVYFSTCELILLLQGAWELLWSFLLYF